MLKACLLVQNGIACGFSCSGHAGYAEYGKDIVCSAASFLSITCTNALESIASVQMDAKVEEESGELYVTVRQTNDKTETIFRLWQQGMMALADEYPKQVRFEETISGGKKND